MNERILAWEGCSNARDLGGLHTSDGRTTRWNSIVRSDTPARLTAAGWAALYAYGIRTIITLRTHGMEEDALSFSLPFSDIAVLQLAIEDITDPEFVRLAVDTSLWGTPLYYKDALQRWPERHAAVITAIARAQPGGVLFHCIRGHDRTGIITLLLLSLAGVTSEEIISDYELSRDPKRDEFLTRLNTSVPTVMLEVLAWLKINDYLRQGGVSQEDLAVVHQRLA
jgi:hypothetical protein